MYVHMYENVMIHAMSADAVMHFLCQICKNAMKQIAKQDLISDTNMEGWRLDAILIMAHVQMYLHIYAYK